MVIANDITIEDVKAGFQSGQSRLKSMIQQSKANNILIDDKNCYKKYGLIKLFGLKKLEVLLIEISGHFGNKDKVKLNFDYHKGIFGMLAMLKSIADDYQSASTEKFARVKIFFLNTAGNNTFG
ncbi:hypothetical protein G6F56_000852 [Rhizopus delemar]|nr:hypothetical protein G6F56_000852 [Rhizopus delemar]